MKMFPLLSLISKHPLLGCKQNKYPRFRLAPQIQYGKPKVPGNKTAVSNENEEDGYSHLLRVNRDVQVRNGQLEGVLNLQCSRLKRIALLAG
jgi:hypothetical protein